MNPAASGRLWLTIVRFGALLALVIAVVGSIVGGIAAGPQGVAGALVGTAMALVFTGLTAISILLGLRASGGTLISGAFFGIVLGGWLLKFIVFIVLVVVLKGQPWVDTVVLFVCVVAGVVGSLVVDMLVVTRSRVPYVDTALPRTESPVEPGADDAKSSN